MRGRAFVLIAMIGILSGCATAVSPHADSRPARNKVAAVIRQAGSWATDFTYTLKDLRSCQISDAITVLKNDSQYPVMIRTVRARVMEGDPGTETQTAQVALFKAGTTTGELAASFHLAILSGHKTQPAGGVSMLPFRSSHLWYDIIVQLRITGNHLRPWAIQGVSLTYKVGHTILSQFFSQSIRLVPVNSCPE